MNAAGYIGLAILPVALLSAAGPLQSAQTKRQNGAKSVPSTASAAKKDNSEWNADPLRGWVPTQARHEDKKSAAKSPKQTGKANDKANKF